MANRRPPVLIAAASAGPLAGRLAEALGVTLTAVEDRLFADGERQVRVPDALEGQEVFLLASTTTPVGENLLEVRLLADACWHAGASRVVGVIPYFGYARQDRRGRVGEALGMRVAADMLAGAAFSRLVLVDLHAPATEGYFGCPVDHLSAVPLLAAALGPRLSEPAVVVAPDFGAAKRARQLGRLLGLPVAVAEKTRLSDREVATGEVLGDVAGRVPVIVDDMISTGATIAAALAALTAQGSGEGALVVTTHGLLLPGCEARLAAPRVSRIFATDSVSPGANVPLPVERVSLAPLLAEAITRIHRQRAS